MKTRYRSWLFILLLAGQYYISTPRCTSKIARRLLVIPTVILSLALLAGCATPYQRMGALGGYQEEQLAPDIYRVAFFGNGYTSPQTAAAAYLGKCLWTGANAFYAYPCARAELASKGW